MLAAEIQASIDQTSNTTSMLHKAYKQVMYDTYSLYTSDTISQKNLPIWARASKNFERLLEDDNKVTPHKFIDVILHYYSTRCEIGWQSLANSVVPAIYRFSADQRSSFLHKSIDTELSIIFSDLKYLHSVQQLIDSVLFCNTSSITKYILNLRFKVEFPNMSRIRSRFLNDNGRVDNLQELVNKYTSKG